MKSNDRLIGPKFDNAAVHGCRYINAASDSALEFTMSIGRHGIHRV